MKEIYAKSILFIVDMGVIFLALSLAYYTRMQLDFIFDIPFHHNIREYIFFPFIYLVIAAMFAYEEMYTKRYDFWQETYLVIKALAISFLIVLSYLALTKSVDQFSRAVIIFAFFYMSVLIPIVKIISKTFLFRIGWWQTKAKFIGHTDETLSQEIFHNRYLGYVKDETDVAQTVFVNSKNLSVAHLKETIDQEIQNHHEVIFIPIINDYNMAQSHIYELSNTRTNLVVFKNRLKSTLRIVLKEVFNYLLAIVLLPILLPIIAVIAFFIKKESPGPVFFSHNRVGKDGKTIPTLKFRSMFVDAQERLEKLLAENEAIRKEWEENFKLKNDPRVTKIGAFLRKTSLDELPQIFNVLKGEMSFVGPRPVVREELERYYRDDAVYYYMVKPGITGLWQVSGRSDTDYDFRVETDKWYVRNWSLWLDIVILLKTIKVVLFREGAY